MITDIMPQSMVLGLDGSSTGDDTILAGVVFDNGLYKLRYFKSWSPDAKNPVPYDQVKAAIHKPFYMGLVDKLVYDPSGLFSFESELKTTQGLTLIRVDQTKVMLKVYDLFLRILKEKRFRYPADIGILAAHFSGAAIKETPGGVRIIKSSPKSKIDSVPAIAMAIYHLWKRWDKGSTGRIIEEPGNPFYDGYDGLRNATGLIESENSDKIYNPGVGWVSEVQYRIGQANTKRAGHRFQNCKQAQRADSCPVCRSLLVRIGYYRSNPEQQEILIRKIRTGFYDQENN